MHLTEKQIDFLSKVGNPHRVAEKAQVSIWLVRRLKYKQVPVSGTKAERVAKTIDAFIEFEDNFKKAQVQ